MDLHKHTYSLVLLKVQSTLKEINYVLFKTVEHYSEPKTSALHLSNCEHEVTYLVSYENFFFLFSYCYSFERLSVVYFVTSMGYSSGLNWILCNVVSVSLAKVPHYVERQFNI